MKKSCLLLFIILGVIPVQLRAQKLYPVTSGEMIFSQSNSSFTPEFMLQYPGANLSSNNVRFTVFFHFGQYIHYDLSDNIGMYTGIAIRNIGMITDETLPQIVALTGATVPYDDHKIIRRQYTLGMPLALKFGSFKKHMYFYGGAEYEMAFHFKEKYWNGSFDRSGSKTKNTQWFSNQTPTFLPSVFAGIQLPGDINVRFTYYLTDFLDNGYKLSSNSQEGSVFNVSDLSRYKDSQVFFISLCWQFNTSELFESKN